MCVVWSRSWWSQVFRHVYNVGDISVGISKGLCVVVTWGFVAVGRLCHVFSVVVSVEVRLLVVFGFRGRRVHVVFRYGSFAEAPSVFFFACCMVSGMACLA